MLTMKINELVTKLNKLKEVHGNIDVIGADSYEIEFAEPQKFIKMSNDYNDIINRHTEDMDENYLEESYIDNEEYNEKILDEGVCVKIY